MATVTIPARQWQDIAGIGAQQTGVNPDGSPIMTLASQPNPNRLFINAQGQVQSADQIQPNPDGSVTLTGLPGGATGAVTPTVYDIPDQTNGLNRQQIIQQLQTTGQVDYGGGHTASFGYLQSADPTASHAGTWDVGDSIGAAVGLALTGGAVGIAGGFGGAAAGTGGGAAGAGYAGETLGGGALVDGAVGTGAGSGVAAGSAVGPAAAGAGTAATVGAGTGAATSGIGSALSAAAPYVGAAAPIVAGLIAGGASTPTPTPTPVDNTQNYIDDLNANWGDRTAEYSQLYNDTLGGQTTQIDQQKDAALRNLKFLMADKGLAGGSADADAQGLQQRDYSQAYVDAGNNAQSTVDAVKANDEQARLAAIAAIRGGADEQSAQDSAQASAQSNLSTAQANLPAQAVDTYSGNIANILNTYGQQAGSQAAYTQYGTNPYGTTATNPYANYVQPKATYGTTSKG